MSKTFTWILAGLLVALALALSGGGYWYYQREIQAIRGTKYDELHAIADLKIGQIVRWREERVVDAQLNASGIIRVSVLQWLAASQQAALKTAALAHLQLFQNTEGYAAMIVSSTDGRVLLSTDSDSPGLEAPTQALVAQAVASQATVFGDFFRCTACDDIRLDLASPILDEMNRPAAILILRVDPTSYFYPLLQAWPLPSKSGETLLVREDGDSVLFLNELRHRTDTALTLRIPLSQTDVPSVQAVLGRTADIEGIDYRGVPVLADIRPVPGSPWFLVAKIDAAEILAEARYRGQAVVLFIVLGMLTIGVLGGLMYSTRQRRLYQDLYRAERERREVREEMRAVFYSIGDGVILGTAAGQIARMNRVAEELTGWREAEAIGQPLAKVFCIVDEASHAAVESPAARALREDAVARLTGHTLLIAKDGVELPIDDSAGPIHNEEGTVTGVVLVFRDITERKRVERAALQTAADLVRSNQDLEQFAYVASHDLQEPLRAVAGFMGILRKQYAAKLGADAQEWINEAVAGAERMQNLIQDLLTYSRVGTRGGILAPTSMQAAVDDAQANLRAAICESDAVITSDSLPTLTADSSQMVQLLQNLIGNAIKFAGARRPEIHLAARREDRQWVFGVRDNGIGIEPQYYERIFLIFQRLHSRTQYPGTGIGLAVCKKIVERHSGTMWVESKPGAGTTFWFTIPDTGGHA